MALGCKGDQLTMLEQTSTWLRALLSHSTTRLMIRRGSRRFASIGWNSNAEKVSHANICTDGLRTEFRFASSSNRTDTVTSRSNVCIDTLSLRMWARRKSKSLVLIMRGASASWDASNVSSGTSTSSRRSARTICSDSVQMDQIASWYTSRVYSSQQTYRLRLWRTSLWKRIGWTARSIFHRRCMAGSTSWDRMKARSSATDVDSTATNRLIVRKRRSPSSNSVIFRWWTRWVRCRTCVLFASTASRRATMRTNVRRSSTSRHSLATSPPRRWIVKRRCRDNSNKACSNRKVARVVKTAVSRFKIMRRRTTRCKMACKTMVFRQSHRLMRKTSEKAWA